MFFRLSVWGSSSSVATSLEKLVRNIWYGSLVAGLVFVFVSSFLTEINYLQHQTQSITLEEVYRLLPENTYSVRAGFSKDRYLSSSDLQLFKPFLEQENGSRFLENMADESLWSLLVTGQTVISVTNFEQSHLLMEALSFDEGGAFLLAPEVKLKKFSVDNDGSVSVWSADQLNSQLINQVNFRLVRPEQRSQVKLTSAWNLEVDLLTSWKKMTDFDEFGSDHKANLVFKAVNGEVRWAQLVERYLLIDIPDKQALADDSNWLLGDSLVGILEPLKTNSQVTVGWIKAELTDACLKAFEKQRADSLVPLRYLGLLGWLSLSLFGLISFCKVRSCLVSIRSVFLGGGSFSPVPAAYLGSQTNKTTPVKILEGDLSEPGSIPASSLPEIVEVEPEVEKNPLLGTADSNDSDLGWFIVGRSGLDEIFFGTVSLSTVLTVFSDIYAYADSNKSETFLEFGQKFVDSSGETLADLSSNSFSFGRHFFKELFSAYVAKHPEIYQAAVKPEPETKKVSKFKGKVVSADQFADWYVQFGSLWLGDFTIDSFLTLKEKKVKKVLQLDEKSIVKLRQKILELLTSQSQQSWKPLQKVIDGYYHQKWFGYRLGLKAAPEIKVVYFTLDSWK